VTEPALSLRGVTKRFGGLTSLDSFSLDVASAEIVSVIGPNGAGKTTLFNVITGVYTPDEGSVLLYGEDLTGLAPEKVARKGIARTFQNVRLFLNLTVRENIKAAMFGRTRASLLGSIVGSPRARREELEKEEQVREALEFFGTRLQGYRLDQPAYSLSYANRRRLEIARIIRRLRDERGYTIVVIEHDMHVVEGISDRVIALDHGVQIAAGSFDEVATSPAVIEAYLGKGAAVTK
jgi:branched-chain amino acid transport system ATP-binding protein